MRIHIMMMGAAAGLGLFGMAESAMAQAPQAQQGMSRMFMEADRNGDGVVDKDEYMQLRGQIFSRLDRNGDGQLTQDDMEPRSGGPGMSQGRAGMRMQRADTNGDGVISRSEWDARSDELFALRDRNKDGKIEPDEMGPLPRTAQP